MRDEELIARTVEQSELRSERRATAQQIAEFEARLGLQIDPLFRDLLLATNGGELTIARMADPYLPEVDSLSAKEDLWEYLFEGLPGAMGNLQDQALPIGDDYAGEMIAFDLRGKPPYPVLTSNEHDYSSLDSFTMVAKNFREFLIQTIAEYDQPEPIPTPLVVDKNPPPAHLQNWTKHLQKIAETIGQVQPAYIPSGNFHQQGVWCDIANEAGAFSFTLRHAAIPCQSFSALRIKVGGEDSLIRQAGGELIVERFKNHILCNEAVEEMPHPVDILLDGDNARQSKDSTRVMIFETAFRQYTSPLTTGEKRFAVVLAGEQNIHMLQFQVLSQEDERTINKAIDLLLRPGTGWIPQ